MGEVSGLIVGLAVLDLVRAWDAEEEHRNFRQEGVFVPFNLPHYRSGNNQFVNQKQMLSRRHLSLVSRQRSSQIIG